MNNFINQQLNKRNKFLDDKESQKNEIKIEPYLFSYNTPSTFGNDSSHFISPPFMLPHNEASKYVNSNHSLVTPQIGLGEPYLLPHVLDINQNNSIFHSPMCSKITPSTLNLSQQNIFYNKDVVNDNSVTENNVISNLFCSGKKKQPGREIHKN